MCENGGKGEPLLLWSSPIRVRSCVPAPSGWRTVRASAMVRTVNMLVGHAGDRRSPAMIAAARAVARRRRAFYYYLLRHVRASLISLLTRKLVRLRNPKRTRSSSDEYAYE